MTMFIKLENGAPVGLPIVEDNFRQLFPNISFSRYLTSDQVEPLGYGIYDFSNKPDTAWGQKAIEATPVRNEYGVWKQSFRVIELTGKELEAANAERIEGIKKAIVSATQQRLDDFAATRDYTGILSACSYATDPHPKFSVEGQYCVAQRSATWAKLYEILAEVQAGIRPVPSGFADVEKELPTLVWPA